MHKRSVLHSHCSHIIDHHSYTNNTSVESCLTRSTVPSELVSIFYIIAICMIEELVWHAQEENRTLNKYTLLDDLNACIANTPELKNTCTLKGACIVNSLPVGCYFLCPESGQMQS